MPRTVSMNFGKASGRRTWLYPQIGLRPNQNVHITLIVNENQMKLRIIKPPKRGDCFVTLNSNGSLYFSVQTVEDMDIWAGRKIIVAHDEYGNLYVKTIYGSDSDADGFDIRVSKSGNGSAFYIRIIRLLRNFGVCVEKTTRYNLIETEEDFWKVEGLKLKVK